METTKLMTTKDVADTLHTSPKVILTNARKCLPNKKIVNGKPTIWTESESTLLLDYMKNNKQSLYNSQAKQSFTAGLRSASTALTPALKIKKAMDLMQEGYEEELLRIEHEKEILKIQNKELQIQLDEDKDWYSIKRMERINPGKHFSYTLLKSESMKMNKNIKKVFDANYGTVNAYHVSVWESLYFDNLNY